LKHHSPGRAQALLEQAAKECGGLFDQDRGQNRGHRETADGDEAPAHPATPPRRSPRKVSAIAQLPQSR
jgi:hypothetical protein